MPPAHTAAALLGVLIAAGYLLYVQRVRLDPQLGVALVAVISAALVLPWALWNSHSTMASAPLAELVWQLLFQGVLIGCIGTLCLHYAVPGPGSQSVGALLALVPVLGLTFSVLVAHDAITPLEAASAALISAGVRWATRAPRASLA